MTTSPKPSKPERRVVAVILGLAGIAILASSAVRLGAGDPLLGIIGLLAGVGLLVISVLRWRRGNSRP